MLLYGELTVSSVWICSWQMKSSATSTGSGQTSWQSFYTWPVYTVTIWNRKLTELFCLSEVSGIIVIRFINLLPFDGCDKPLFGDISVWPLSGLSKCTAVVTQILLSSCIHTRKHRHRWLTTIYCPGRNSWNYDDKVLWNTEINWENEKMFIFICIYNRDGNVYKFWSST